MLSFIPDSKLLTALALCFALGLIVPAQAMGQEEALPPFDSFSYLKDPLFNPASTVIVEAKAQTTEKETEKVVISTSPVLECPSVEPKAQLKGMDEFKTRLAIDKALSQILKLTVDYAALRNRVSSLCQPAQEKEQNWFAFGQKGTEGEKQLEALQEINQKQIADRDKQLSVMQTRLEATKKRYDNESVARLLAEKRLKVARDGAKKNDASITKTNRKVQMLAEQLKQNQVVIRQLKIDLTNEKMKVLQLSTGKTASPPKEAAKLVPTDVVGIMPALSSISDLSVMSPASEWTIQGLEFEKSSAEIKLESAGNLDKLVDYLKQNKKLHIQVNGYTDSTGSAASNLKLSQKRAQAVADYLQQQGVDQDQINVLAYGERRPVADNETEAGRVKNRRVAVLFLN